MVKTAKPGATSARVKPSVAAMGGGGALPSTRRCRKSRPLWLLISSSEAVCTLRPLISAKLIPSSPFLVARLWRRGPAPHLGERKFQRQRRRVLDPLHGERRR